MGKQATGEQGDILPTRFGAVVAGVPRTIGTGFTSLRFGGPMFERDTDPILMLDHFVMTGATFAPHLHQRITTITALFEDSLGSFHNRDTVGGSVVLEPGDLYRLAAGSGAVHEQRPGEGARIHALQIFVKLPCALHHNPPQASHVRRADVALLEGAGYRLRAVLGAEGGAGMERTADEMALFDGVIHPGGRFTHHLPCDRKAWLYVISGQLELQVADSVCVLAAGQMTTVGAGAATRIAVRAAAACHFILITAEPVPVPGGLHATLRAARPAPVQTVPDRQPAIEEST